MRPRPNWPGRDCTGSAGCGLVQPGWRWQVWRCRGQCRFGLPLPHPAWHGQPQPAASMANAASTCARWPQIYMYPVIGLASHSCSLYAVAVPKHCPSKLATVLDVDVKAFCAKPHRGCCLSVKTRAGQGELRRPCSPPLCMQASWTASAGGAAARSTGSASARLTHCQAAMRSLLSCVQASWTASARGTCSRTSARSTRQP